jgi:hypothetical protein
MYKTKHSTFLLGLPIGFAFLLSSYVFLGLHMINLTFYSISAFSSILMWLRVITQSIGFTLIVLSYYVAGRNQGTSKSSYLIILLGTTFLILGVFGLLFLLFSPSNLLSVYTSTGLFTTFNLALLSYIILFLCRKIQLAKGRSKDLLSAPLAFVFLWVGQFSFLVWSIAISNTVILIGSQVARIVSFVLFVLIYYAASKESSTDACVQAK